MTGQQALQILQQPVFGDQLCIDARDLLRLVADAEEFMPTREALMLTREELIDAFEAEDGWVL
jgi:hypothetical protein